MNNNYKIYRNNLNEDLYYLEIDDLLEYISIPQPKTRTQRTPEQIFNLEDFVLSKGEKYVIEDSDITDNFVFTRTDLYNLRDLIQDNFKNMSIEETQNLIKSFDRTDELSIYTKNRIELNFTHNRKVEHEEIKIGETVNIEFIDKNTLSYKDIKYLEEIKRNDFFKALSNNNVNEIKFVKSDSLGNELYINIPTAQGDNIIYSKEQVQEMFDKYPNEKENTFIHRPKENNLVLAV